MITYAVQTVQAVQRVQDGGLFGDGFGVGAILLIAGMILSVAARVGGWASSPG